MRKVICSFVAGLMLIAVADRASARGYCNEPHKPYCVDGFSKPDSRREFDSCRTDVERYLREVTNYARCLREEANDAIRESDRVVDRFNCMAKGNTMCF